MNMTHYMSLLADNQPWNLIIFMAIPVIFAETITVTEFFILFSKNLHGPLRAFNRACSIIAGLYFTGIFIYLMINAYIPLTVDGDWHTWVDVVAVTFYLSGVLFLLPLALLDLGLIARRRSEESRLKLHFLLVSGFLVVAHVAMIFGMVNPEIVGGMAGMMH
ncbi:DUF6803 family protein [Paenibacillus sp. NFR01]|uniref:DUF6803 family protein n=1 Tax=Paenibacillus sp. NFR01 TaxID=1566279 RepID=UPI0008CDD2DB|nr:DUF6803 family protein [Paenibacillus sp. NFR01]SET18762.1 hypothetical protein SAMN03159358_0963 [Paenibacillus sp. NFR01]